MRVKAAVLNVVMIGVLSVAVSSSVQAAPLPWSDKVYSHFSDQEPLSSLLKTLALTQNTQISVSDRINDVVSVHFQQKTTKAMFDELAKSHGLIWYYDGGVLYVSKKDEIQTGSISLTFNTTKEFSQSLRQLGILDDHFYWVESEHDNTVYFKGPERFVSTVLKMSKVLDKKPTKPRVYKWVDKNGVPTFSSTMPGQFNNDRKLGVVDVDSGVSVVGSKGSEVHWLGDFSR